MRGDYNLMPLQDHEISIWFENEVRINEPALRAYLQNRIPAAVELDDVIQETYARIVKVRTAKPVESPRGLLFSIAKNLVRDQFRKKYAARTISLGDMEVTDVFNPTDDTTVDTVSLWDETEILKQAILELPKKCRTIFLLRNYENLSYKEIARRLNLSTKTVEAQLAIGIKKCRKYFEVRGLIDPSKSRK